MHYWQLTTIPFDVQHSYIVESRLLLQITKPTNSRQRRRTLSLSNSWIQF